MKDDTKKPKAATKPRKARTVVAKKDKAVKNVIIPTAKGNVSVINKNKDLLIAQIIELRAKQGYTKGNLVKYVMHEWKVGDRQARVIVKEASVQMGEVYNQLYTDSLADSVNFMEEMKQEAMREGDLKMVLDIQKELNKINQLYVIKQEISMRVEQPLFSQWVDAEVLNEDDDEV
mgnify:CR=1 FL=1|tara:strand:- start:2 stop:526 length:525 start_codon:yes stop_codon:yes gene_type:complete